MAESAYRTPDSGILTRITVEPEHGVWGYMNRVQAEGWIMSEGDAEAYLAEPGIADDLFLGRPFRGRNELPCGYLASTESTGSTALVVTVDADAANAFKAGAPVLVAKSNDILNGRAAVTTTNSEWRMVTAVTTTGTAVTLTVSSTTNTYYKNSVVVQMKAGKVRLTSEGNGYNRFAWNGLALQLGNPDSPTATNVATTTGTKFTVTKGSNAFFAKYADIYICNTNAAALDAPGPNDVPDIADLDMTATAVVTSAVVNTYGGGAAVGGGALTSTTTYWTVIVLKEKAGLHARYRSLPCTPVKTTTT